VFNVQEEIKADEVMDLVFDFVVIYNSGAKPKLKDLETAVRQLIA